MLEYHDEQFYALFRTYGQQNISCEHEHRPGERRAFQSLSDMCSLSISPDTQKWYFHHESRFAVRWLKRDDGVV